MSERVFFVALVLFSAYLLKRSGVFTEESSKTLIDYVLFFSLPALVIQKVREVDISSETITVVVFAWTTIIFSLTLSFLVGKLFRFEDKTLRSFILVSSFGNTAFMGYPFTFALFGEEGLKYAVLYDQLGSFLLVVSLGLFVATGRFSFKEVITFPPFIALVFAFIFKGIAFPQFIEVFLDVVGKSLIPVVLFAVGLRFSPSRIFNSLRGASIAILLKMVVAPAGVLALMKLLDMSELYHGVILLESAMPPMVMAGVLAMKYDLDDRLAISAITLGILISFLTVPIFMGVFVK